MLNTLSTEETVERRSQRRQAESQIFSLEADRSHLVREEAALDTTLRGLRQSLRQVEAAVREQEEKIKRVENKLTEVDGQIQRAKKAMRLL